MVTRRYAVIMAGGRGQRLWPHSRLHHPKQILPLAGDKPMLTQTVERLEKLVPPEDIFVVTIHEQRDAVASVCSTLPPGNVVSEPRGCDTAAAVGLAMVLAKRLDPNASLAMLPADHAIHDTGKFQAILDTAFRAAEKNPVLVTIGVTPTEPATGYGYIRRGEKLSQIGGRPIYKVEAFVEKPDRETAKRYLDDGGYLWNAGMFVWTVPTIENALREHAPGLAGALTKIEAVLDEGKTLDEVPDEVFQGLEKISIDYALMEKARNVATIEADFDWDDVGSWPAVARHLEQDERGNTVRGAALVRDGDDNIVFSDQNHLVAVCGIDHLIVVHTSDATLICPNEKAQDIKKLVDKLGENPHYRSLT